MNERDNTLLDNYFNGLLGPEDALAVEARAVSESEFGAEFSLRKEMEAFPRKEAKREAFLATLRNMEGDYFQGKGAELPQLKVVRNNMRRWIALAASVTLIAAAVWFFNQGGTPDYEQYAQHTPLSLTVMGNTAQAKTDAETAFGQKDYARALAALDQVLIAEPDNIKATFYRGICILEIGRGSEARAVFESIAAGNSALREDAVWYIGLSYLKEKDLEACKAVLGKISVGEAHYGEAQKILKGL
jgi:tetratricopeptide (TPR) repeat protein